MKSKAKQTYTKLRSDSVPLVCPGTLRTEPQPLPPSPFPVSPSSLYLHPALLSPPFICATPTPMYPTGASAHITSSRKPSLPLDSPRMPVVSSEGKCPPVSLLLSCLPHLPSPQHLSPKTKQNKTSINEKKCKEGGIKGHSLAPFHRLLLSHGLHHMLCKKEALFLPPVVPDVIPEHLPVSAPQQTKQ